MILLRRQNSQGQFYLVNQQHLYTSAASLILLKRTSLDWTWFRDTSGQTSCKPIRNLQVFLTFSPYSFCLCMQTNMLLSTTYPWDAKFRKKTISIIPENLVLPTNANALNMRSCQRATVVNPVMYAGMNVHFAMSRRTRSATFEVTHLTSVRRHE